MRLPGRSVRHSRVLSVRPPTHVGEREREDSVLGGVEVGVSGGILFQGGGNNLLCALP